MPKGKAEFVDFKAIKQSVTMLQVLDHYGITASLKCSGDSLSGPCPLHGGENPTQFRVSLTKNCFNCFGDCKSGGNVLDFVVKMEKTSIRQAALLLQQWFGVGSKPMENTSPTGERKAEQPEPKQVVAPKQEEAKPAAKASEMIEPAEVKTKNEPLGFALRNLDTAHAYLQERGLTPETIATFGLGYCAKGSMGGRIAIPIHDSDGKLIAYAGRWPGNPPGDAPKYKLPNGFLKSLEVYNLHNAAKEDPSEPLVVVEGFFDCIKLWQAGFRRVVSVMGSSISDAQAALIERAAAPRGSVIILFDADSAGRAGCEQAVRILSSRVFVKAASLCTPGLQPDMLSPFEIAGVLK